MKALNRTILSALLILATGMGIGCADGVPEGNDNDSQGVAPMTADITFVQSGDTSFVQPPKQIWMVSDSDPDTSGTFVARGGTLHIVAPQSSGIELQFPMRYKSAFRDESVSLEQDTYRKFVAAGDTLTLSVKKNAPLGDYEYAALIIEDCILAIGDSVPTIKVPE